MDINMADFADDALKQAWSLWQDEQRLLNVISYIYIICSVLVALMLQFLDAPYGRYARDGWGFVINARFAWFVQEVPSVLVPLYVIFFTNCPLVESLPNSILIGIFLLHYIQRSFVYPFLITGGKPTPFIPFLLALVFCTVNGYLQVASLAKYVEYGVSWLSFRFICGVGVFFIGMFINIQSDSILRNLRKPGEMGYKIPKGGMFDIVSGANFFGEILEWSGFALAAWSMPAFVYVCFTLCNLGPRAIQHHRWYKKKFDNYPINRKALIPFIL